MKIWSAVGAALVGLLLSSGAANATTLSLDGVFIGPQIDSTVLEDSGTTISVVFTGESDGDAGLIIGSDAATAATSFSFLFDGDLSSDAMAIVDFPGLSDAVFIPANVPVSVTGLILAGGSFSNNVFIEFSGIDAAFSFSTSITAVPLPAAAWLFISAVSGLFLMRGRQRRSLEPVMQA